MPSSRVLLVGERSSPTTRAPPMVVSACSVTTTSYHFVDTSRWLLRLSPATSATDVSIWAPGQSDNTSPTSFMPFSECSQTPHMVVSNRLRLLICHYTIKMQGTSQNFVYALCGDVEVPGHLDTPHGHRNIFSTFSMPIFKSSSTLDCVCCLAMYRH